MTTPDTASERASVGTYPWRCSGFYREPFACCSPHTVVVLNNNRQQMRNEKRSHSLWEQSQFDLWVVEDGVRMAQSGSRLAPQKGRPMQARIARRHRVIAAHLIQLRASLQILHICSVKTS